jgi:Cu/Ag efflux pump CusA
LLPQTIVDRIHDRNINMPGGTVELPDQRIVVRPTGEYTSASEIGGTVLTVSQGGYPLYLRDLVEVHAGVRGPA